MDTSSSSIHNESGSENGLGLVNENESENDSGNDSIRNSNSNRDSNSENIRRIDTRYIQHYPIPYQSIISPESLIPHVVSCTILQCISLLTNVCHSHAEQAKLWAQKYPNDFLRVLQDRLLLQQPYLERHTKNNADGESGNNGIDSNRLLTGLLPPFPEIYYLLSASIISAKPYLPVLQHVSLLLSSIIHHDAFGLASLSTTIPSPSSTSIDYICYEINDYILPHKNQMKSQVNRSTSQFAMSQFDTKFDTQFDTTSNVSSSLLPTSSSSASASIYSIPMFSLVCMLFFNEDEEESLLEISQIITNSLALLPNTVPIVLHSIVSLIQYRLITTLTLPAQVPILE